MLSRKIIFCQLIITIALLFLPTALLAAGIGDINSNIEITAQNAGVKGERDIVLVIGAIIRILLGLLGVIFVLLIIYGGFQWMTAMGATDKVVKAKKLITNAVIGLIIVVIASSIAYFITLALESGAK